MAYFLRVVTENLPKGITIEDISELQVGKIPTDTIKAMSEQLANILRSSRKSSYRSPDEIAKLAEMTLSFS